jgi:nitroreductase
MLEAGYSEKEVDDLRCTGDLQTMSAVIQLILLAAWEKGFGGCWMTAPLFARKELEELLGITDGNLLAAIIPIGKPAAVPAGRGRKAVEEVISFI